jgi:hypothetical protein
VKNRAIWAFIVSAALAAVVWALSVPLTGKSEPWDAEWPYYLISLASAGAISGAVVPKYLGAHYIGAVLGQAAYEVSFLNPTSRIHHQLKKFPSRKGLDCNG